MVETIATTHELVLKKKKIHVQNVQQSFGSKMV